MNTELEGEVKGIQSPFDSISQKLASLDGEFNTMKGFGLKGMLDEAQEKQEAREAEAQEKTASASEGETKPVPDAYAPLNTSIQKLREDTQGELGKIANRIEQIARTPAPVMSNEQQELTPEQRRIQELEARQANSELRNEWYRAKAALERARVTNPGFDYSDNDLISEWNKYIGNNVTVASQADWDHFFNTKYMERKAPEWRKEAEEAKKLKEDLEKLRSNRNTVADVMSMPRASKNVAATKVRDDKAMSVDEDIYQQVRKKFPKGRFIGITQYANDLQQRRSA